MSFFLRNISISILLLTIFIGSLFVYLSSRSVYEAMLNQVLTERISTLETLGTMVLDGNTPTLTGDDLREVLSNIKNNQRGVISFRLVDTRTGRILESADSSEKDGFIKEELPVSKQGVVSIELNKKKEPSVVELSYLGSRETILWMSVDQSFFINPAIIVGIKQVFILFFASGILFFASYSIIRRFFMRPVRQLKSVLSFVEDTPVEGKEDSSSEDKTKKQSTKKEVKNKEGFGELLESFTRIAERIEATIEHDKVISQSKSDFISTTAHQLRTPLSGINWALGGLLSSGDNFTDEQKNLLQRSLEKTKELVAIVGELLSAAGIEQGKFGFHREEVSIKDEIDQVMIEERDLAQKNNVRLQFDHAEEEFPMVYVDRERIRWVIRNLIENAIRYNKKDGKVTVSLTKDRRKISVSVKDTGIGISPDAQQHIFEKFFRSNEAKRKRNDGSGLGLYIVKNIINYHGGRLWFESVEGVGTTFFFNIPISKGVAPEAKT